MSFVFYTSGEKDYEDGDIVYMLPSDWKDYKLENQQASDANKVEDEEKLLPKEFRYSYYIKHRDCKEKYSREWWDWERLRIYAMSTKAFLKSAFQTFAQKFNIDLTNQKLPAFLLEKSKGSIDIKVQNMARAETELAKQYSNGRRTFVNDKIKRHKVISRLRDSAVLAWGCYYSCKDYYSVKNAKKIQNMYNSLDRSDDGEVVRLYGECEKMKYYLSRLNYKVSSSGMSIDECGVRPSEMYEDMRMIDFYNYAMENFGIDTSASYDKLEQDILPNLKAIMSRELRKREILFYRHYGLMRRLISKMQSINRNFEEGWSGSFAYSDSLHTIFDGESVDLFEKSIMYRNSCNKLMHDLESCDKPVALDARYITCRFNSVINIADKYYWSSHLLDTPQYDVNIDDE